MSINHNGTKYIIADAHAHIYPGKIAEKATAAVGAFYGIDMHNLGASHILNRLGGDAGIDFFLVCSVATTASQVCSINKFISSKCNEYENFTGLGAWHQDLTDIDKEFDNIMSLNLKGIKLHPDFQKFNIDDSKMIDVYKEANRRNLTILFHTGDDRTDFSSPSRLANVIDIIPDLKCIAAHLGGYRRWNEAKKVLKDSNVYIDTSSSLFFLSKSEARDSIYHFGVDHTLFGTDFPMWEPKTELERFFKLDFSEEQNKKILFDNFKHLFNL